eukprot:TRINITY_DN77124_c0_g1_i1.p1 TRINITY_DN77124_c0_g1~~TRINITY_DN77124_c0_g1_i1.p1  ORF type:complete len:435 (-),score=64.41 TRINITY_DN77124_c0_g1_i1:96-1298(-)
MSAAAHDSPEQQVLERLGGIRFVDIVYIYQPIGAQRVNLGRALYERNESFRQAMKECDEAASQHLPQSILEVLYPSVADEPLYAEVILQALYALPCLFAVSYSLTRILDSEHLRPSYVIGHSLGEFMAAVAAGVFDMRTAMGLVCIRANLMHQSVSGGSMIAIKGSSDVARSAITSAGDEVFGKVSVAAITAPEATTLAGEWRALGRVLRCLPDGMKTARVKASHADHSPLMEPIATGLRGKVAELFATSPPRSPQIAWYSTVTGMEVSPKEAADPEYWVKQMLEPVRFTDAVAGVLAQHEQRQTRRDWGIFELSRDCVFLEIGESMLAKCVEACLSGSDAVGRLRCEFRSMLSYGGKKLAELSGDEVAETVTLGTAELAKRVLDEQRQRTIIEPFLPNP